LDLFIYLFIYFCEKTLTRRKTLFTQILFPVKLIWHWITLSSNLIKNDDPKTN
jgi:hypothetical protein